MKRYAIAYKKPDGEKGIRLVAAESDKQALEFYWLQWPHYGPDDKETLEFIDRKAL